MIIMIESTDMITEVNGRSARVWRGVTVGGVECDIFIAAVRVRADADCSQFEAEMKEIPVPSECRVVDIRHLF